MARVDDARLTSTNRRCLPSAAGVLCAPAPQRLAAKLRYAKLSGNFVRRARAARHLIPKTKMRDALAPRIRWAFAHVLLERLVKRPSAAYRRFAFFAFLAVLRGAFLAAFFLGAARLAFLATFLAAFFAFLAMPWLLFSHGNEAAVRRHIVMRKRIRHVKNFARRICNMHRN